VDKEKAGRKQLKLRCVREEWPFLFHERHRYNTIIEEESGKQQLKHIERERGERRRRRMNKARTLMAKRESNK
jgi:hypothetical protein